MDTRPHGQFTVSSLYKLCSFTGVRDMNMEEMWHSRLPLKVRNFIWLVIRNRVQTTYNLDRKKWKGSKFCQLCNSEESVDHMLFQCPIVVFMWAVMRDARNWSSCPRFVIGFKDFFFTKLGIGKTRVIWFLFGAICWTLWLNRNDFIFSNKLISSPRAIIFKMLSFLQHMMVANAEEDRRVLEKLNDEIKSQVSMKVMATRVG
jgi:hypothetical protein